MNKILIIASLLMPIWAWAQEVPKKALSLQYLHDERKPKIIYPGERITYKTTKDHLRHEGKIRQVTDSSIVFTDISEVKFADIRIIRKNSIFKETLGLFFAGGSALLVGGVAVIVTGASGGLPGLTALGIVMVCFGTPIAGATGYPFFAIRTRYDIKKDFKATAVTAEEIMNKKKKVTEL
ncbi:MAG: hypothetical protein K2Q22_15115 [Cytophagales bacterium]|nr:hypothetical protein [Cytophagales bacterium]